MGIINAILNLFFGGNKKQEVKELDKAIKVKDNEVKELEKEVKVLEAKKKVNKKEVAKLKRKVTTTKKQIEKASEAVKEDNADDAVKFLKKFSKQYIFIYMRYIIYILFVGLLFAQDIQEPKTYSFTEEQVLGFTNAIKELELKDSLNVSLVEDYEAMVKRLESTAVIDSMLIANKTTQIDLLKDTNKLLEQKVKLVRPKWYENKWLYFTFGVALTATSVKLAGQIVD